MKRDMELIRLLLMDVEEEGSAELSAYTADKKNYHKYLLVDAGLVLGRAAWSRTTPNHLTGVVINSLTWQGHEFLDAARNESTWKEALGKIGEIGVSISFDVLKTLLIAITKEKLNLP